MRYIEIGTTTAVGTLNNFNSLKNIILLRSIYKYAVVPHCTYYQLLSEISCS